MFEKIIKEDSTYLIKNMMVVDIYKKFKPQQTHKFRLTFLKFTKCTKFQMESIPKVYFDLLPFPKILVREYFAFFFIQLV